MNHSSIVRINPQDYAVFKTLPEKDLPLYADIQVTGPNPQAQIHALFESLPAQGLAVIGTRYPQRRSLEIMERAFEALAGKNLVIISGFARGIDSQAHELALEYGLKTIAILGCGIDFDYPRENRRLKDRILESGGLILSEFERDASAYASHFLRRNRLIAGFSKAVWVVEGAAISGTLNTATWAAKYGRDLYATSCFPGDTFYQGNEKLLCEFDTELYPIAKPFFAAQSLAGTWNGLSPQKQASLPLDAQTSIQKWVLELYSAYGSCQVQALMSHAYQHGLTPGKFYLEFEEEIQKGLLYHHQDGRVTLSP